MEKDLYNLEEDANRLAFDRILQAQPVLVDAIELCAFSPNLVGRTLTHSGPPINWERMSGAQRGAVVAAILYEEWATSEDQAEALMVANEIALVPNHQSGGVGPMGGVISPHMYVLVVEDRTSHKRAYSAIEFDAFYGVHDSDAMEELRLWNSVAFPAIGRALRAAGGIALKPLMAKALAMGDELHSRQVAASSLLANKLAPWLVHTSNGTDLQKTIELLVENELVFLPISMAACKATLLAAEGIEYSTIVTAMARNGTDFGIRVSGLGDEWFIAPSPYVEAVLFPGYTAADQGRDIGDSAITETGGLGAFSIASAPVITDLVGGTYAELSEISITMRTITQGLNPDFAIPLLNFEGPATGIDIRKVVQTGIVPRIDTAVAHREPGHRIIGAGLSHAPMECFRLALDAWFLRYLESTDKEEV